jgi:hypothetical protein
MAVSRDDLSERDRAVLFALLGTACEVSNPELKGLIGFPLDGQRRHKLNDLKYVESNKRGRVFVHELSDAGWHWCAEDLAAGAEGCDSSLERAHYLVFGVFMRFMDASGRGLADVFGPASPSSDVGDATDVAARVEVAYRTLAHASGEFVKLRELRLHLADITRTDLDAALAAMFTRQRINLIPESHQQALSAADRESALRLGGEYKHLISIE